MLLTPGSRVGALAWELWRPNLAGIVGLGLVAPLSAFVLSLLSPQLMDSQLVRGGLPLLFLWGLIYLLVIFSYAEFSSRTLQTGFPQHVLRLPVSSTIIAAVPLGVGVLILVGYVWMWMALDLARFQLHPTLVALAAGIGLSWMQVLNWGLSRSPIIAGLVLVLIVGATGLCLAVVTGDPGHPAPISRGLAGAVLTALLASGVILCQVTVRRVRRGQASFGFSRNARMRLPGLSLPARLGDGRSAQFRYEWRLFGWILPAVALFLGLLGLIVPALPGDDTLEATGMLVAIFVYVAGALGLELGKSHFRKDDYRMTGFWAIRPLPDAALAATKLRMTAMSVAVGTVVFYLPLIGGWLLAGYGETLAALWQLLLVRGGSLGAGFIVLLAIGLVPWVSWVIAANLMAVCLSGHRLLGGRLMLLAGPVFLAVAWLVYRLSQSPIIVAFLVEHATPIGLLPTVAMVGLVVFLRRHFGRSWRSLLPRWALAGGGVLLVLLPWAVHQAFPDPFRSLVAVITVNLILAALLPLVTAPLALSVNRHRG